MEDGYLQRGDVLTIRDMNLFRFKSYTSSLILILSIIGMVLELSLWYVWVCSMVFSFYVFAKEMLKFGKSEASECENKQLTQLSLLFIIIGLLVEVSLSLALSTYNLFYVILFFAIIVINIAIYFVVDKRKEI